LVVVLLSLVTVSLCQVNGQLCPTPDTIPMPPLDDSLGTPVSIFVVNVVDFPGHLGSFKRFRVPVLIHTVISSIGGINDAWAAYDAVAVGLHTDTNTIRRPAAERTATNKNIAILIAIYNIWKAQWPLKVSCAYVLHAHMQALLTSIGVNWASTSTDLTTPEGIGIWVANQVIAFRNQDGMNILGDYSKGSNGGRYQDYTDYEPVNTPWPVDDEHTKDGLLHPERWVPLTVNDEYGEFRAMRMVTPQLPYVKSFSLNANDPKFRTPGPYNCTDPQFATQADTVINLQATITDEQRLKAEHFDIKINSLAFPFRTTQLGANATVDNFAYDVGLNLALFDALIVIWNQKRIWDAARPDSVIPYVKFGQNIQGIGKDFVVTTIKAADWRSIIPTDFHSEYPSGTTCLCLAFGGYMKRLTGSPDFVGGPFTITYPAGSSKFIPNFPVADTVLSWNTYDEYAKECGVSRLWAGVHFQKAVDDATAICGDIGDVAFTEYLKYRQGTIAHANKPLTIDKIVPKGSFVGTGNPRPTLVCPGQTPPAPPPVCGAHSLVFSFIGLFLSFIAYLL